jgi:lysine 6-dehydrogenase
MDILILGAGMMGRAVAFDLATFSKFDKITIFDKDKKTLESAKNFLKDKKINYEILDVGDEEKVKENFRKYDVAVSAVPYYFNYFLTKTAINTNTHFIDLGGNNTVVEKQLSLSDLAEKNNVTVIADCGLAPGLVSIITRDIVDFMDEVDFVKIRVGGLPLKPVPPFNYQIVFSPNGLINEYMEDALILDNKKIVAKKSMTKLEEVIFPYPFSKMEAFLTSGGCSTLPYTFRYIIRYLDYKTIRYPGHCEKIKPMLDLGFGSEEPIKINNVEITPRKLLIKLLREKIPCKGKDVVLLKIMSQGIKNNEKINIDYQMIDYFDEKNNITSMMRTTAYPVAIIADMINSGTIKKRGVHTCENIVSPKPFFQELKKRNILIKKKMCKK